MRAGGTRAERDVFLAMLVHETRAPLNGVMGFLHLLEETPLTAEQRAHVAAVRHGAEALCALSADLIDFLRTGSPEFAVENVPVDPRRCLEESAAPLHRLAARKGIFLREEADPSVPTRIGSDPRRLRQIMTNLLSNAVKFTDRGGVAARLSQGADPHCLLFEVRDTGPGMTPETLRRLFEPFFRAPETAGFQEGTGLGLTISRRLARRLGGTLDVARDRGKELFSASPCRYRTRDGPATRLEGRLASGYPQQCFGLPAGRPGLFWQAGQRP